MKPTPRINRINAAINRVFPSNRDAWWVSNSFRDRNTVVLHLGYGGEEISAEQVARLIFRTERSVSYIKNNSMGSNFARHGVLCPGF